MKEENHIKFTFQRKWPRKMARNFRQLPELFALRTGMLFALTSKHDDIYLYDLSKSQDHDNAMFVTQVAESLKELESLYPKYNARVRKYIKHIVKTDIPVEYRFYPIGGVMLLGMPDTLSSAFVGKISSVSRILLNLIDASLVGYLDECGIRYTYGNKKYEAIILKQQRRLLA